MTVKELIEKLQGFPEDAQVYYEGGEYLYDYRSVSQLLYFLEYTMVTKPNSVIIK